MYPAEWIRILKAMASVYPDSCSGRLVGELTGLENGLRERSLRNLTRQGFVRFDPGEPNGTMLGLTEAGMAIACDRAGTGGSAPDVLRAVESAVLRELHRCRLSGRRAVTPPATTHTAHGVGRPRADAG